ncbi:hypothetical protein R1flu_003207 [Riccia fluitans]|uniref:Uncharacterized protein n=1 Tax=Riccia fluitans TaxID=41844 RepID=A0ABD1YBD4_9MARC
MERSRRELSSLLCLHGSITESLGFLLNLQSPFRNLLKGEEESWVIRFHRSTFKGANNASQNAEDDSKRFGV